MFSSGFLVGSVGGPVLGQPHRGPGTGAPFLIYGAALLIAAAVVFVSLRHSSLAAPELNTADQLSRCARCCATGPTAPRCSRTSPRGGRRSGCASRWCRCSSSRCSTAGQASPGLALATFAIGNVSAVIPSGYLSDRVGRRKLLIVGLTVAAVATVLVGFTVVAAAVPGGAYIAGFATGIFTAPQQAAVADIIGNKARGGTAVATFQMMADLGSIGGSLLVGLIAQHLSFAWAFVVSGVVLLLAARGLDIRPGDPGSRRPPSTHRPAHWARRPAAKCRDQRF